MTMKSFRWLLVVLAGVLAGAVALAQTADSPLGSTRSAVAEAFAVDASEFEVVDLAGTGLGDGAALAAAIAGGESVVRVRALDDGSSVTLTRCWVLMHAGTAADAPTSATHTGASASLTGVPLQEGDDLYLVLTGRWLSLNGEVGSSRVHVARVR